MTALIYGIAMLAPWNVVLSSLPFYDESLPDTNIDVVIAFAMNGLMIFVVILCVIFANSATNRPIKINLILLIMGVIVIFVPLIVRNTGYWVTVTLLIFLGVLSTVVQASVLAYMSMLPEKYMAINSVGIGLSAILLNFL